MARLKIAFVYDALYPYVIGGAERRYHELAKRLARDHEVHSYSWTYWSVGDPLPSPDVRYHGVGKPPPFYGDDGKRRIAEALAFALRLAPHLARSKFDVIDCASMPYLPTASAQICARVTGSPLVVTWHEFWGPYWRRYLPSLAPAAAAAERLTTLAGDVHVAVSPYTARKLTTSSLGRAPVVVVPNGVDIAALRAVRPAAQTIDVVFLGRLIREKRVDLLLRGLAALKPRRPDIRCSIVGDGPMRRDLERLADRLGLNGSVTFAGFLNEGTARAALRGSKLCLLPSEREGFGMVALESQAMGVPVIVTRSAESAATDLVDDGVTGLICEPQPDTLAAAIDTALGNAGLRRRLAENGRRVSEEYAWDRIADKMEVIYYRATSRRRGHGYSVQRLPGYGGREQAADPCPAGASAGR